MLKIAICDDEKSVQENLLQQSRAIFAKLDIQAETKVFSSGLSLLDAYEHEGRPFDLIFLDIRMDDMDGMETAKKIRSLDEEVLIIFITSSAEYVFQGYEVKAFRYIMKSELSYSFERIFKEALRHLMQTDEQIYTFQFGTETIRLPIADILYCESRKRILIIHTERQEYKTYEKMDNAEASLSKNEFVRCHQSYLVNVKHIRELNKNEIILFNENRIPISKRYQKAVSDAILWNLR